MKCNVSWFYVIEVLLRVMIAATDPGGHSSNQNQWVNVLRVQTNTEVSDAAGQHGIDHHPAVFVDVPALECECSDYSDVASGHEYSEYHNKLYDLDPQGVARLPSCREGGQVDFIVSVRGLVSSFVYEIEFKWTLESDGGGGVDNFNRNIWKSVVTDTDIYTLREPLLRNDGGFHFGRMAWDAYKKGNDPFVMEVTVRDMYPALTSKEALVGARKISFDSSTDSSTSTVRLKCAQCVERILAPRHDLSVAR
jgi:hypothetical protein